MERDWLTWNGRKVPVISVNTVVVGSGAAGWNGALRLREAGVDVCLVTEGRNMGTSRNTGSDKQTYYKLSLSGTEGDSPRAMAEDLFAGGSVDGDLAYAEAANSTACFLHLAELGVAFPTNRLGEYVGYRTDHDLRGRATSAGPLTSKEMTERLEQAAQRAGIPVEDQCLVLDVIRQDGRVAGLIALQKERAETERFLLFRCANILYATGGPAGIYSRTVYPAGHSGGSGVAFRAGVRGQNLTEWQFGLASVSPRWNVSGTYMQVLPRLVSVDADGVEREFLLEYAATREEALNLLFRKGYEWPFDSRKAVSGSSVVDLLVWRESVARGRRVFLDYRRNPFGLDALPYASLEEAARSYLDAAGAAFGTPVQRLRHMNEPAYQLYRSKGVDLEREMLEIALCAQHNNGGLAVDAWWQTCLPGFYAAGEVAGTHGVYRPGGSALNAGQVGSLRAARHIAAKKRTLCDPAAFADAAGDMLRFHTDFTETILRGTDTAGLLLGELRQEMDAAAGAIRREAEIRSALAQVEALQASFTARVSVDTPQKLATAYRLRDVAETQRLYLTAMLDFIQTAGMTRGSALYALPAEEENDAALPAFRPDDGSRSGMVQEIWLADGVCHVAWRPVRPLPEGGGFFENVWRGYRENGNIDA